MLNIVKSIYSSVKSRVKYGQTLSEVDKKAMIRNRYNRIQKLTRRYEYQSPLDLQYSIENGVKGKG